MKNNKVDKEIDEIYQETQITLRNVPVRLRDRIMKVAESHRRSMNNEILFILEELFPELDNDKVDLRNS